MFKVKNGNTRKKFWNMFKVNHKNSRMTSCVLGYLGWNSGTRNTIYFAYKENQKRNKILMTPKDDTTLLLFSNCTSYLNAYSVPICIVLPNRIVHLNTVNRIFRNWAITSFKIQHSPDFRKQRCGEKTIWFDPYCPFKQFSTVFFKGWNSWIQLLFYFFLEHRLKTLNKENIIWPMLSKTLMVWPTLHFPIFLADCD